MIEQKIEKKIVDKIKSIFATKQFGTYAVYGSLQPDILKGHEGCEDMIVVVKFSPRSYQSPTTPVCQIEATISLTLRAEVDYNGNTYIDVCDALMNQYEKWQKCLDDAHTDFAIDNEFNVAGFQMGNGTTSIDGENALWQYSQTFTIFGITQ